LNNSTEIALHIEKLNLTFNKNSQNSIVALDNVNLTMAAGDFAIITGDNGSGKSTLLNCIAGKLFADKGNIVIANQQINHLLEHQRSQWIGRVFQNPADGTAADLSISDNYRLAELRGKKHSLLPGKNKAFQQRLKERLSLLGMNLENKTEQMVGNLSGGQRQALSLLMATAADTKLLLLDEPTAALDPKSADLVLQIADKLISTEKITTLMVTHSLKHALDFGKRLLFMRDGQVMHDVKKSENNNIDIQQLRAWFDR